MTSDIRLIEGDNMSIMPTLEPGSFDAIITDPPYASGGLTNSERRRSTSSKYQFGDTIKKYPDFDNDCRDQRTHAMWSLRWLSESFRLTRQGGFLACFSDWRQLPTMSDAIQIAGWTWRGILTWDKTEACRPIKGFFRNQTEFVLLATKGQMSPVANVYLPGCVRNYLPPAEKRHLTAKPVPLMVHLMRVLAPGSRILDPFAGSGSTLVAAREQGHHCLGIELSPSYAAITRDRLNIS